MDPKNTSVNARRSARAEADRLVLEEAKALVVERQAKSAALREARLKKEAEDASD